MARKIKLTQRQVALVDNEDYERVNAHKWFAQWSKYTKSFYAARNAKTDPKTGKRGMIPMHRFILGLKRGDPAHIDHKNRKTLDNRRGNLRVVDNRGNQENRHDKSKYGTGVRFFSRLKLRPFAVRVQVNRETHYLGYFATAKEARAARTKFLKSLS